MIIPIDMRMSIGKSHNTPLLNEELQELMAAEKGKNQFSPGTSSKGKALNLCTYEQP